MNKEPIDAFSKQNAIDSEEVFNRKATLIAMLNDIKLDNGDFTSLEIASTESISNEDYDVLTFVLSDAIRGEDIPAQYPKIYKKLLTDSLIRQTFLDMLNTLETDEQNNAADLLIDVIGLSFL